MRGARSLAALLLLLLLAAAAPPAVGASELPNHPPLLTRFHPPAGSPVLTGEQTPARAFEDACGIAVDSQGDIYVSDYYHDAIDIFDRDGTYLTQIAAVDLLDGPCGLAVDAAGNLYVNTWHRGVLRFAPSQYPLPRVPIYGEPAAIGAAGATAIALDPAGGDLYVSQRTHVDLYSAPVLPEAQPSAEFGVGSLGDAYGIAVSAFPATEGWLYVADASTDTVKLYDPATSQSTPLATLDGASTPSGAFVSLTDASLAIDQSNGHLLLADDVQPGFEHPAAAVYEFGPSGLYRGQLAHALIDAEPLAIAVDESTPPPNAPEYRGDLYVSSGNGTSDVFPRAPNPEESVIYAFGPAGSAHTLSISLSGAGQGTVSSQPAGISCAQACAAEFNSGASITITATPAPGSIFGGWSAGGCGATPSCQLSLDEDLSLSAEFLPGSASQAAGASSSSPLATINAAPFSSRGALPRDPRRHRHRHRRHRVRHRWQAR